VKAFYFALGAYSEQESKKLDQWKEQSIGQLFDHMKHEMEEIKRSMTQNNLQTLVHNSGDILGLASIFMAKVMEMGYSLSSHW
jgi:hypothetical protein